ncbi:MAG: prephenate dehydratase, partial [Chloroflexi bacterium]|nr:prephenate dehydratase [Chloroflexota bacterium]
MRVAIQGERGSYSEEAAIQFFGAVDVVACRWFDDAFAEIAAGRADCGVIPIENSQAGSINDTYDLLLQHDLPIVGEVDLPVRHCLLALPGVPLAEVRRVYSHPQALAQCEEFIARIGAEKVAAEDTAGSARLLRAHGWRDAAAIASARAGELYGLDRLAEGIQTNANNRTRFVVLSPKPLPDGGRPAASGYKTSMVFVTPNTPGSLYHCLGVLATRGINLVKIESRPYRPKPWDYVFYVDFDGHTADGPIRDALDDLRSRAQFLKILGS